MTFNFVSVWRQDGSGAGRYFVFTVNNMVWKCPFYLSLFRILVPLCKCSLFCYRQLDKTLWPLGVPAVAYSLIGKSEGRKGEAMPERLRLLQYTCKDRARARCRTWGRGKGKWVSGIREDTEKGRRKTSVEILCKGEAIEDEEDRKRLRGTQREEMREKGQKGRKKGGNDIDIRGKNTRDWRRKCRRNVLRWKWVIEGEGGGPQEKWQEGRSTTVKAVRSTIKGRIEELWC